MDNNIEKKVIGILSEFSETPIENIKLNSRISGDLGLSSLDIVSAIIRFEDEFNIDFDDQELSEIQTVEDVIQTVKKKLKKK